jgi:CubicO group peptidase (beta-lactamase class C family)
MEPIGASKTWRWHGYENSWVELDGERMQSVSGGGHWGGGMHISARDLARFGYLFQRMGVWGDRRIISEEWIRLARTPGVNPNYGFMNWFLNHPVDPDGKDGKAAARPIPKAPESSVTFRGAGANIVYIDWENDLVVVVRWIGDGLPEFIGKVLDANQATRPTENGGPPRS